jgi:hypothetical protein
LATGLFLVLYWLHRESGMDEDRGDQAHAAD